MEITKFKPYGIAIVAANKPLDSKDIECTPIETAPMVDGEITDNMMQLETKGKDAAGGSYETSTDMTTSLKATWLPMGSSNRATAPDVRRGEYVVLYQYGDSDQYWWTTLFYDMKLRKLETVLFAISNERDESKPGTAENTYFIELSTHNKTIHLHTSKSDGEPFVYDIQLNTKDGNFIIQDDVGNFFSFDSTNTRLEMKNADGSHLDIDRKDISLYAPNNINLRADNDVNVSAGNSINSDAGSSINDKTDNITTRASQTVNDVPMTNFTGHTAIAAGMSVTGTGAGGATATVAGSLILTGGDVKADEISLKDHVHKEMGDGADTGAAKPG